MPKHGPRLGSLSATMAFLPIKLRPSVSPTEVVVLPSPAVVGVIAVTKINFPSSFLLSSLMKPESSFALKCPYGTKFFSSIDSLFEATSEIFSFFASLAISRSVL